MKTPRFQLAWLILGVIAPSQAAELDSETLSSAKAFLVDYVKGSNTGNGDLAALYRDTALIYLTVTTQNRQTQARVMNGPDWKRLLRERMATNNQGIEPMALHQVRIQGQGQNLEIAAQRYALNRCYWDLNYRLVITREGAGPYQIVKENRFSDHNNQCQAPTADILTLKQAIKIQQNPLP